VCPVCGLLPANRTQTHLLHLVGILFPHIIDDARSKPHQIHIVFCIPVKLVRLIKMCLNETYYRIRGGKYSSDIFPVRNGLKQGEVLSPLLFNFVVEYAIRMP
jgi:hypothetical protein